MKIFVPKETMDGETRVAATPETIKKLIKAGSTVSVESGAGTASAIADQEFEEAGATMVSRDAGYQGANLVLKLHTPTTDEASSLQEGASLVSFLYPHNNLDVVKALADRKATSFAMELVPRISRAQKMDALSSQSNIAGYKAVILAADHLPKMFPLLMTAAGTIKPARVVILGAGVAGLQAIATAKRLGAVVDVSDIRPAVKEQVESLGGRFIEVESDANAEDAGGYAKEASEDYKRRQAEALLAKLRECDVVITTALIPGRPAPKLVSEDMLQAMPNGSVLVDLAAEQGGNCVATKPGEICEAHGVKIIGTEQLASHVAVNASDMYAKNVLNFLEDVMKEGELVFDMENEVTQGSLVMKQGEVLHAPTAEAMNGGNS